MNVRSLICLLAGASSIAACDTTSDAPMGALDASHPIADAGAASLLRIDLGEVISGEQVDIEIPENALGFQIVVESSSPGPVGIRSITAPNGDVLASEYYPDQTALPSLLVQEGIASAIIPHSSHASALSVAPGAWRAEFTGPETLRASAYVRVSDDGAFHGGTLDITLYIPEGLTLSDPGPVHAVDATSAETDIAIAARIDAFYAALDAMFDIGRGEVRFVAIDGAFLDLPHTDLGQVMKETVGDGPTGAHFVLVNSVEVEGTPIWGISAGSPGTSTSTGHPTAGVVMDVSVGLGPIADGYTMLHELGHYAGLIHTTQPGGDFHDSLSDTPACTDTSTIENCPDAHNIMFFAFWGASGGTDIQASAQQRRVMHASPLYDAFD